MPVPDVGPDRRHVLAVAEADAGDTATVLDPRRSGHDRADHRLKRETVVNLEERRAAVEAVKSDMAGVHA